MSLHKDTLREIEADLDRLSTDIHYEWASGPQASGMIDDITRKLRVEIDRMIAGRITPGEKAEPS